MSYHVYVVRNETRDRAIEQGSPADFFEREKDLEPFTKAQLKELSSRLEMVGFKKARAKGDELRFENRDLGASALLSKRALYLTASGEEAVFEIQMIASEWAGEGQLAKFDPQAGEWE
jgi:hypothetical protein